MNNVNHFWCIIKYSCFPKILGFWGNSKFLNSKLYGVMTFFQGIGKSMKIAQIARFQLSSIQMAASWIWEVVNLVRVFVLTSKLYYCFSLTISFKKEESHKFRQKWNIYRPHFKERLHIYSRYLFLEIKSSI